MALLEAMAARVPIVAARVGGVPDVVTESEALLVPPGRTDALVSALATALSEDQTDRVEAAARRLGADFSLDTWLTAHEEMYRDLVTRKVEP